MLLINGLSGSLKLLWDSTLTNEQKEAIKTHRTRVKRTIKVEEGTSATQEVEEELEDVVETLLYAINRHFGLGNDTDVDNPRKIIKNLNCYSMGNLRCYKDIFLLRIYIFKDCNARHWKETLIDKLPSFMIERVYNSVNKTYPEQIPWKNLTYAQLTAKIIESGLDICNEIKI
uniref:Uncharacterized protein n=1 Tax=Cucumis melo TaxID=3656 RepID=A0A9I9EK22_CUCME